MKIEIVNHRGNIPNICLLIFSLITINLFSASIKNHTVKNNPEIPNESESTKQEMPCDEEILNYVSNHEFTKRIKSIKCDFSDLEVLFDDYMRVFGYSWDDIRKHYSCEEVRDYCMEKERRHWTYDLNIITPQTGYTGGDIFITGHYIKPPYKLELNLNKKRVIINNYEIGSVRTPRVKLPANLKYSPAERAEQKFEMWKRYQIRYEKKLKINLKQLIAIKLKEWGRTTGRDEVVIKLENYLGRLKKSGVIRDFKIINKDKIYYDVKLHYLTVYYSDVWDLPRKYLMSPEKFKRYKEKFGYKFYTEEEKKKNLEEMKKSEEKHSLSIIKFAYNTYTDEASTNDEYLDMYTYSGSISGFQYSDDETEQLLLVMLSDATDYQKILGIRSISVGLFGLWGRNAKELIFNAPNCDYMYLMKKIIKRGGIIID